MGSPLHREEYLRLPWLCDATMSMSYIIWVSQPLQGELLVPVVLVFRCFCLRAHSIYILLVFRERLAPFFFRYLYLTHTRNTVNMAHHQTTHPQNYPDIEKDHAGSDSVNGKYDLHHNVHDEETALRRMRTAGSLTITPELFEKIYLSPKNQVSNNIRSTFGNPTPL